MVSLICCYNQIEEYNQLLVSVENQDISVECIGIDNTEGVFSSAASALNFGAERAKGDVLVFLHQDIRFLKSDALRSFLTPLFEDMSSLLVVGLYGAARSKEIYSNNYLLQETLDECCIALSRKTWEQVSFNEDVCDGWHLYAVELCLRLRRYGGKAISAIHHDVCHLSSGNVDERYMRTFKKLLILYKDDKMICTTCKCMPANLLYYYMYYVLWAIKKKLFGNYTLVHTIKCLLKGNIK